MPENLFREAGMGIVGTAAMIAYSSWKETQIKIIEGAEILDNYSAVKERYLGYFKGVETPRNDIVSTEQAPPWSQSTLVISYVFLYMLTMHY
jgi:hypothetical protein